MCEASKSVRALNYPFYRVLVRRKPFLAMKFGRNLSRNQVPEWSSSYINYKGLKKLIKSATEAARQDANVDLAGECCLFNTYQHSATNTLIEFFFSLDRNLEDVNVFYNKKFAESKRRLLLLQNRYGMNNEVPNGVDRDEIEDLMGALLELRGQLRKLQWYGEVNRRGFVKITKKLDKKVPHVCAQRRYLASKVDPKHFATNAELFDVMNTVNSWLSALGEADLTDDSASMRSSQSLRRVSSKATLNLPSGLLDNVEQALRNDDASILSEILVENNAKEEDAEELGLQGLLLNLLQRSISCRARTCVDTLLGKLETLEEDDDINKRNCIHRLVITIGRLKSTSDSEPETDIMLQLPTDATNYITPAASPILAPPSCTMKETNGSHLLGNDDEFTSLLQYLLNKLRPQQRSSLQAKDCYGRMPLHYAAQFGFPVLCQIIIKHMQSWNQFDVTDGIDSPKWQDLEGWAPLHLSVIGGHPITTKTLLEAEDWKGESDHKLSSRRNISKSSAVLALATKANFAVIVKMLVDAGVDIDYQDEQGETALHIAARFGHDGCARALLEGSVHGKANTELAEINFAWTPLFVACVDGQYNVVELLIDAGAELDRYDLSGWTAKEHAALRGHLDIARRLAELTPAPEISESEPSTASSPSPPRKFSLEDRRSAATSNGTANGRIPEPVKTFGHRYLTKESMVLVSLGTMDTRKTIEAVKLDRIPLADAHLTQLDTALSVVVSASGADGEPSIIDLPVQDNVCTDPIVFTTHDTTKVKLLFDIVPTYAGSKDKVVGRAVALLSSIRPHMGSRRITLQGDLSVPIMAANTLEYIGCVNFNFLVITPFTHPKMSITENQMYWKSMTSTMVIGHRGDLVFRSDLLVSS